MDLETKEDLKRSSSKRKQEQERHPQTMTPKIGYFSKDGKDSDDSGRYMGDRRTKPRFDKRNKSDSPGWMPKRNETRAEVKGEHTQDPSPTMRGRQGDRPMGRSDRDQRPKAQHQKKEWKERSEGHSRGDKKRTRDYSRGDNPSRRIRPPT